MAGTFPGVSGTQQIDLDGRPNVGAQLSVFMGGTNDLADTFQDIGLAIPGPNPLYADDTGRLPLFFVADGTYKVRLVDAFGSIANGGFEYPQCPSIGASSSGGGGSAVDPTTILSTGDVKFRPASDILAGFTRMNGRTIGNAVSGASERAASDTQAQFLYLYNTFVDAICPVPGGRSGNALTDFNGGKQITLLDMRGRGPFGLPDMGSTDNGMFSGITFSSGSATAAASKAGAAIKTLQITEIPIITPAGTNSAPHLDCAGGTPLTIPSGAAAFTIGAGSSFNVYVNSEYSAITASAPTFSGTPFGGGLAFDKLSPAMLGTWYMKL